MIGHPLGSLALALVVGLCAPALAQDRPARAPAAEQKGPPSAGVLALLPPDSVTEHTLDDGGLTLAYTATAGTLSLYDLSGERTAALFYTAYVLKDAAAENRPVTFVFNGGPGAASAYLHLGLVGPTLLEFGPTGDGAQARLRDNPQTWIAFTDLVLIDPIGTGWSRTAKPDNTGFYGVNPDAQAIAKAIALYLARTGRTGSPKYLLGESYGGYRAVKVARVLQRDQGMVVAGIVMLSPLIEGGLQFGNDRFALGAALQLPSLAAAELDRRHAFSEAALAEAEHFALTEYLTTLAGPAPEGEAARAFYARVAAMTGLPVDLVTRSRGFVRSAYVKHVRGAAREIVSPYDASFMSPDPFPESETEHGPDPILDGYSRAYGGAFVGYARDRLGFKTEMTYQLLARDVSGKWDWHGGGLGSASVTDDLRELLSLDPSFKVLIAHGWSDLVVPYAVSRYVVDHLPRIGAAGRVALKLYRGGHMFYTIPPSRAAFTADAKAFYGALSE